MSPRRKKGGPSSDPCLHCAGGGCIYCGWTGLEERRLALTTETEHPALTDLDLAAHAWAVIDGRTEAKHFANAVVKFARTVNEALTGPDPKGQA
jgi:hypothetical protein